MSLLEMFCAIDDFWLEYQPYWYQELLTAGVKQRQRRRQLVESEIMTILVYFHQLRFRDFKTTTPATSNAIYRMSSPTWSATLALSSSYPL